MLLLPLAWLPACSDDAGQFPSDGGATGGVDGEGSETLYAGMGEYSPTQDWHAILRFDNAEVLDSSGGDPYVPDATIPVVEPTAFDGTALNFAHGLHLDESRDEMYIASIFTSTTPLMNGSPETDSGSVGVMSSASSADGPQALARHIFGDATGIKQPHGVWLDESRDMLYVANTFARNVLVFEQASSADGNLAPSRTISHDALGNPVFVYVDEPSDRMFVATMNASLPDSFPQMRSAVNIYNDVSSLDGQREPDVVIAGEATRLEAGNNRTTHNVWYDSQRGLMLVGHHTNELLIFDLNDIDLSPSTPTEHDIAPRVLEVHEESSGSDIGHWSVYGLFYLGDRDRLYVACGHVTMQPTKGAPPNAIKIYDGLLDSDDSGIVSPDRVIHWTTAETYYPPQPLWVSVP